MSRLSKLWLAGGSILAALTLLWRVASNASTARDVYENVGLIAAVVQSPWLGAVVAFGALLFGGWKLHNTAEFEDLSIRLAEAEARLRPKAKLVYCLADEGARGHYDGQDATGRRFWLGVANLSGKRLDGLKVVVTKVEPKGLQWAENRALNPLCVTDPSSDGTFSLNVGDSTAPYQEQVEVIEERYINGMCHWRIVYADRGLLELNAFIQPPRECDIWLRLEGDFPPDTMRLRIGHVAGKGGYWMWPIES